MSSTLTIKRGDTAPPLAIALTSGAAAVNLTTASAVKVLVRREGDASPIVDAAATVTDAAEGLVSHTWTAGQTDTAGSYRAEVEVTWGDGKVQTFPAGSYLSVVILPDLG